MAVFIGWLKAMRYYIDSEFIEDGKTIDLISIGLVAEDERELYAENLEADLSKASEWVKSNAIPSLWSRQKDKSAPNKWIRDGGSGGLLSHKDIAQEIIRFIGDDPNPEFHGEWCSYDWVALCQLFGTMMDLPTGWPMRCRDVVQFLEDQLGLSQDDWPKSLETDGNHNALMGARTVKARWEWCEQKRKEQRQSWIEYGQGVIG